MCGYICLKKLYYYLAYFEIITGKTLGKFHRYLMEVDCYLGQLRADGACGWWKDSAHPVLCCVGKVVHILHFCGKLHWISKIVKIPLQRNCLAAISKSVLSRVFPYPLNFQYSRNKFWVINWKCCLFFSICLFYPLVHKVTRG